MYQDDVTELTITAHPTSQGPGLIRRTHNNLLLLLDRADALTLIETLTRAFDNSDKVTVNIEWPEGAMFYPKDRD
jgi:hypothetical protein